MTSGMCQAWPPGHSRWSTSPIWHGGRSLSVDDGGVLRVDADDVQGLVVDMMNSRDAAILHGCRYARVAGAEEAQAPRAGLADLGAAGRRAGGDGSFHVDR